LTEREKPKPAGEQAPPPRPEGRLLALDLGRKRVGVAITDELGLTVRPLPMLRRTNWKELLLGVAEIIESFDARGLVIGLPLNMDGSEGLAASEARRLAHNFERSLAVPVFLQDERLTSRAAEEDLRQSSLKADERRELVDSQSASIILHDFLARREEAGPSSPGAR
jgi:putative Holliday junction resolvase